MRENTCNNNLSTFPQREEQRKDIYPLPFNIVFKICLLIKLYSYPTFSHFCSPPPCTLLPPAFPSPSLYPWVIHVSSLASPFPILFLTSPSILYLPFMLCLPCTFSPIPFSSFPIPDNNPPCNLHFCDSVPVLVVCLVCFCFCCFRFDC